MGHRVGEGAHNAVPRSTDIAPFRMPVYQAECVVRRVVECVVVGTPCGRQRRTLRSPPAPLLLFAFLPPGVRHAGARSPPATGGRCPCLRIGDTDSGLRVGELSLQLVEGRLGCFAGRALWPAERLSRENRWLLATALT